MPKYQVAEKQVHDLAKRLIQDWAEHKPIEETKVTLDILFAFADTDEKGHPKNDAITKNGVRAYGLTRVMPLKDRVAGRADVEILLDGDYWAKAQADAQAALLDHELYHINVKTDQHGNVQFDDINRPMIQLRKHDVEVGWFNKIALRHELSVERMQAKIIMDNAGQYYWPGIAPSLEIRTGGKSITVPVGALAKAAALNA